MAAGDKYIGCLDPPLNWETMLQLPTVKDEDGNYFFNLYYNDLEDCEGIESAEDCLVDLSFEEVLKLIIVEDDCGRPAINVIGEICDECGLGAPI